MRFQYFSLTIVSTALISFAALSAQTPKKGSDLYGVIEIGSSGIKPLVIQAVEKAVETTDAGSGDAVVEPYKILEKLPTEEGNAINESAASKVAEAVLGIQSKIAEDFGVPRDQIFIVGSSGLAAQPSKGVVEEKINAQLNGRKMEFISAEKEATLAFRGVLDRLPTSVRALRYSQVLFLDIGSGNTRGAYVKKMKPLTIGTFEIPWGTKTFTKKVDELRGDRDFAQAAAEQRVKLVVPALRDAAQRFPALQNLHRIYLAGGASYAMASLLHPESQKGDYVVLDPADFSKFHRKATTNFSELTSLDGVKFASEAEKTKAENEVRKITTEIFSKSQIIAAAELLKALNNEFGFDNKSDKKPAFFFRSALYAWPMGYLAEKIGKEDSDQ